MMKSLYIVCLLLANFHPSQLAEDDSEENEDVQVDFTDKKEGDLIQEVLRCLVNVSKPTIDSPSQEAIIGWNVTLECVSHQGSPPINYMLYKGKKKVLHTVTKNKAGEKALFNFVLSSDDELGEYKCKVENKCNNSVRYSSGFNFKVPKDNVVVIVVAPLLLIVLAVTISLLILWCRARKSKPTNSCASSVSTYPASENCATYEKIGYKNEDVAYTEVKFDTKEKDYRKVLIEEDTTVNYAEVAIRK